MKTKYKYIVSIHNINFDSDGQINSQSFKYEFTDGTIVEMRKDAFDKVNEMTNFFENEMPADQQFDLPSVAKQKRYKNTNGYSIDVFFFVDEYDYHISGDMFEEEALVIEAFEIAKYFKVA